MLSGFNPQGGDVFSTSRNRLAVIGIANEGHTKVLYSFNDSDGKKPADIFTSIAQLSGNDADYGQYLSAGISLLLQNVNNASFGYRNSTAFPNVRHIAIYATLNAK